MVFRGWSSLTALAVLLGSAATSGQSLDPRVLQQLQGQLSGNSIQSNSVSPLDQARAAGGRNDDDAAAIAPGARIDTPEEQQLRRQQSRAALSRLYTPSPIEREFRNRLSDPTLRQFGYDLFQATQSSSGSLTGSVSDSYVVGIGDELVVQFQGATNESRTVRVDREGKVVVGALPPIYAAGRSIGSVRRDLAAATRRTLLGTEVYVSLGSVRAITVFVGGEVDRPGQYNLTSLSDISSALALAGGVRRSGSLRNVRIARDGGTVTIDLYGLLGIGNPPTSRLRDGDRIIVPVIGDTVAIAGGVARPGIYEVRRGTSVGAVLDFAGGALRPRGNSIAISRINADGSETFVKAASLASKIDPGDAIQLVGGSAGGATGRVVLRGYVQNPGPRPLVATPTVRDLLGDVSDLRFDSYLPMAVLIRRDPVTAARVFEPVNLITALRSSPGVALNSDDRLYVFSRTDIDFINQTVVRRIVLGQRNPYPECRSLARLETLVSDSKSPRFNVVTQGSFIIERNGQSDVAVGGSQQGTRRGDESFRSGGDDAAQNGQGGQQNGQQTGQVNGQTVVLPPQGGSNTTSTGQIPPDVNRQARASISSDRQIPLEEVDQPGGGSGSGMNTPPPRCPAVFEEEPELLPVLIENAVSVGGDVRRPGAYPVAGTISTRDIASVAQGLLSTDGLTLDLTHSDGSAAVLPVAALTTVMATTYVRAGDDLRFNAPVSQSEAGAVLLSGEFSRPGLYSIRRGETLSQLFARAGGITSLGYPYGAIFTRRSVKEAQQEGIRRTGRELSNALLAVSARKTSSGDSIAAASRLIDSLSTVEAPGRVVVEADPRALALRSDLDTVLESGDAIYMPKRPNFVLALGDVSNPGALQFIAGKSAREYISETGGTSKTADKHRIYVVLPNGTAQPLRDVSSRSAAKIVIPPGSTILVPKDIDPLFTLDLIRDVTGIFGTIVTSIATVGILATTAR
ncbi:MAG: SLBB domain-containing protein [Janthinobacterium lividum]